MNTILRKILIASLLLFHSTVGYCALNSAIVWEVRTTGNVNNGGGFKLGASGSYLSQQDAAQYALTTATTAAADAIILDASAAADMVGNVLYIVSGTNFTVGFYEVISVVVGVSITVDRNCTTAAGALGVINIGGATNHPNSISAAIAAGNTIHMKLSTYQPVGANAYVVDTSVSGTSANPIKWIGYNTTRNDNPTGANRPAWDANSVASSDVLRIDNMDNYFYNIIFKNAADDGITDITGGSDRSSWYNCRFTNNGDDGASSAELWYFINCEFDLNGGDGISETLNTRDLVIVNCYIHNNTSMGIRMTQANIDIKNTVIESNGATGCSISNGATSGALNANNCVAYNNTGASSDGFSISTTSTVAMPSNIINCSSVSNGQYAFNNVQTTSKFLVFDYNNYFGHTTELNNITAGANDTGDTDPLFTDPANGDFTLQSTSPLIGVGSDVNNPTTSLTGAYKTNIGVDQDDNTAAGGGGAGHWIIQ